MIKSQRFGGEGETERKRKGKRERGSDEREKRGVWRERK